MSKDLIKKACEWINNPKRNYDEGVTLYKKLGKNHNLMRFFDRKDAGRGMATLLYNLEKLTGDKYTPEKKELTDDELKALFIGGKVTGYDYYEANRLVDLFNLKPKSRKKPDVMATIAQGYLQEDTEKGSVSDNKTGRLRVKKHPTINYDELPADLKVLFDENGKLESEKKSVHAKMTALPEDDFHNEKRKEYAELLDAIEKSQAANWKVIDDWWAKKDDAPAGDDTNEPDPVAQAKKEAEEKAKRITNLKSQASRRTGKLKKMAENDPKREGIQKEIDSIVKKLEKLGVKYTPRK